MAMTYQVQLENFEGPLDLLLFLLQEHEIDIYDIPVALITHQYLEYLELLKLLDLEMGGDYILMAATLIRIKSKMLLPRRLAEEATEEIDPRQELVQRLLEYRRYKEAAHVLGNQEDQQIDIFYRPASENWDDITDDLEPLDIGLANNLNLWDLLQSFKKVIDRVDNTFDRTIEREAITVEDRKDDIMRQLHNRDGLFFKDLFNEVTRPIIIGMFLALLELIRTRKIAFEQTDNIGEIWLYLQKQDNTSS
ncbi:MAG TPA: segregation/condensation protein A [Candidatus Latescibacteria bacterium]|nr:segregation/condensation protein A [Candidatus Latescibacterota bacterium]